MARKRRPLPVEDRPTTRLVAALGAAPFDQTRAPGGLYPNGTLLPDPRFRSPTASVAANTFRWNCPCGKPAAANGDHQLHINGRVKGLDASQSFCAECAQVLTDMLLEQGNLTVREEK